MGLEVREQQQQQGSWGGGNAGIGAAKKVKATTATESDR
jgi:hypothetical protein